MSAPEQIDGTAVEEPAEHGREIVYLPTPAPTLAVTPSVQAAELVERLAVIREAQEKAMVTGVDYGVVPGTDKPTLLKPGAEKLSVLFQLDVQLANEKQWGPGDHLTVTSHATVFHAPTGARLGYGEGVCTTRERKYAYRKQERTCPACGAAAVIKGKAEFGGGWLCWKKRNGCGAKFADGDQAIEGQPAGEIDNPDLPDLWNTVVKMAEKRARVDAVLAVTGASALFTQDMEDAGADGSPSPAEAPAMGATTATGPQKAAVRRYFTQYGLKWSEIKALFARANVPITTDDPGALVDGLLKHQVSALLDLLKDGAVPTGETSDVPSDLTVFDSPAEETGERTEAIFDVGPS